MRFVDFVWLVIIAACIAGLAACKDSSEPLPVIAAPPVLRNWTPEEECALACALAPYPSSSVLWTLHDDWARMRREIGVRPKPTNYKCRKTTEPTAHLLS